MLELVCGFRKILAKKTALLLCSPPLITPLITILFTEYFLKVSFLEW